MKNNKKSMTSVYNKKKHPFDVFLYVSIYLASIITVLILIGIISYVLINGVPYITIEFLTTQYSENNENLKGILPMIINTVYIVVITLLIATPIGISSAIYLTQYAKQGKLVKAIRFTTEVLSGIPSIIFGLFGYTIFCTMFRLGTSIIAGCLTMTLCILPIIIRTTEESLMSVPKAYSEGALALGAGKLRTILGIVLPCAMPGVLTAVILAMGRIVGESAALLYTSGMAYNMPKDFIGQIFSSGRTLTLHLYQISKQANTENAFHIAFATASVLLILIFILNLIANFISRKIRKG